MAPRPHGAGMNARKAFASFGALGVELSARDRYRMARSYGRAVRSLVSPPRDMSRLPVVASWRMRGGNPARKASHLAAAWTCHAFLGGRSWDGPTARMTLHALLSR